MEDYVADHINSVTVVIFIVNGIITSEFFRSMYEVISECDWRFWEREESDEVFVVSNLTHIFKYFIQFV